jgi:hypothetical protein
MSVPELDPIVVRRDLAARWGVGTAPSPNVEEAARRLLALHGTDPATVVLSAWARTAPAPVSEIASALTRALEADRSLIRVLAMRQTLHIVHRDDLPEVLSVYIERLGPGRRKTAREFLVGASLCEEDGAEALFDKICQRVLATLGDKDLVSTELAEQVPELRGKLSHNEGKAYGGTITIGGRLLDMIGAQGLIVRARTRGSWRSSTCSWARLESWSPLARPLPASDQARTALIRRYLAAFGPATPEDAAWWTGLPKREVAAAARELGAVEVTVRGWPGPRWVLPETLQGLAAREVVGAALLPALDPVPMGYKDRSPWLDPEALPLMFDRSGNIGPSVWYDGVLVGGWGQAGDGTIGVRLFTEPGPGGKEAIEASVKQLHEALAGERVAPRFPTPLTKEFASS